MRRSTATLILVSTLLSPLSSFILPSTAAAADLTEVGGWATLGSVTPAPGCWVDANIEVRREGFAVPNVDVSVDLVHDGEIVSSDGGSTDGDGIAYLGVDTKLGCPRTRCLAGRNGRRSIRRRHAALYLGCRWLRR